MKIGQVYGNQGSQNIKIRLIDMIFTSKLVLEKFKIFLLKMVYNAPINETIVANYEFCVN
jgi:hypothetical protein